MKQPTFLRELRHARIAATCLASGLLLAGCGAAPERSDLAAAGDPVAGPDDRLFMDVHRLGPGGVQAADVAAAHAKDLAVQEGRGVDYLQYWVDEAEGTIYCLVEAQNAAAAADVHREAHGLLADEIVEVERGVLPGTPRGGTKLFMDTQLMGAGGVHAEDVAEAHEKDLAVQSEFGVNFLEYWVDETSGRIHCLAEAPSREAVIATHRKAHGLLPDVLHEVVRGE